MAEDAKREWIKIGIDHTPAELRQFGPTIPLQISTDSETDVRRFEVQAQLDTGANHSCCSPQLGTLLGTPPVGSILQHKAGSEPQDVPVFRARLWFPGGTNINADFAVLASLAEPHAVLIGRDILAMSRLEVNFITGRVDLHFKVP